VYGAAYQWSIAARSFVRLELIHCSHIAGPSSPWEVRTPNRQIRSLVLCVDLIGSRPIWPAHVGGLVDPDGSRRNPSDRLDDQTDDQLRQSPRRAERVEHQTPTLMATPRSYAHWSRGLKDARVRRFYEWH